LLATDLSENANQAMEYAASLAEAYGARITVLHVVEKVPPNAEMLMTAILGYENIDEYRQKSEVELIRRIKRHLEQFCAKVADQMVKECRLIFKHILVEPGNVSERIVYHTESGNYDVLVMGNRGLSLLQEAFMGGTSRNVLQSCRIPVFIIPYKPNPSTL
jgi:nucleotide-binding universal stress UspA family protein